MFSAFPEESERVVWIEARPLPQYMSLVAAADVVLEPFPFGGGVSSFETFWVDQPIVIWPLSRTAHSIMQITLSTYSRMGIWECVADTVQEYVSIAVRMATDAAFKQRVMHKIASRKHMLFEDERVLQEWDLLLRRIVDVNKSPYA